jgi:hypothetical protein
MKKLLILVGVLLGVLVLSLGLVSVAMAATDTTPVSGTISETITVDAPASITLTFSPGQTAESAAQTITVQNNVAVNVKVKDQAETTPGYMKAGATSLASPLQVKGGDLISYAAVTTEQTLKSNWAPGENNQITDFYVQQAVAWTDPPGDYSLTLVFTASAAS